MECSTYIVGELRKRVRKTAPLPSYNHKQYKIDNVRNYNRNIRRIQGEGQVTISQLMATGGTKSDSDSDFVMEQQQKKDKKSTKDCCRWSKRGRQHTGHEISTRLFRLRQQYRLGMRYMNQDTKMGTW